MSKQRQSGLTIVELMIALLIASILLAGLIGLFLTTRDTRRVSQHLNQVADDARFFSTIFAHDVRMAGYHNDGCSLSGSALAWSGDTLTIRYCKPGYSQSNMIEYEFDLNDNSVSYEDQAPGQSVSPQPLLDGLKYESIWFGEQGSNGVQYSASIGDVSKLKTVRLTFQLQGSLKPWQIQSGNYATPTFNLTVAIRNNL